MSAKLRLSLLLLLFPAGARALQLSDIRNQIRNEVRDTAGVANRYSDTLLNSWINEAQREVNDLTWCVRKSTSITLSAGTTYYALPDDFLAASIVVFAQTGKAKIILNGQMQGSYLQQYPDFENSSRGSPVDYFVRQSTYGATTLQIAFVPIATSNVTGTMRVDYLAQPVDLAADTDIPFNGLLHLVPYHQVLVERVATRIGIIEEDQNEAAAHKAAADEIIATMIGKLGSAPDYNPGVRGGSSTAFQGSTR